MKETFERVERHLYKRQYPTADGQWRTAFYAIFTDWKKVRRKFPVGDNLDDARDELGRLHTLNKGRHDWDAEKEEKRKATIKAITVSEWLDRYLDLMKGTASHGTKIAQSIPLKRLLGHLPLSEVTKVRLMEYRNRRKAEPLTRNGEPVDGTTVKGATVNREISCLVAALNLAADEGLCEGPPRLKKDRETPRDRTLSEKEFEDLLAVSDRWLQRVLIAANETALDQGVLLRLTWADVHNGLIAVGRDKTGAKQRVGISPALAEVLDELRAEYRKVPNVDKRVFTKGGKPIPKSTLRHAFDAAVSAAKIEDFQFRDFRHCARTRWAANGLPFEVGEIGIGHKLRGVAGRYVNLSDDHIRDAFAEMFARLASRAQNREAAQ
ncbi:MAG TPA: tyrosine-type recombinase/integrase [Methylomirabilota bacterium]|nr:tyrosine-type recombinase/integrase [Methylomirabilota bacterium]